MSNDSIVCIGHLDTRGIVACIKLGFDRESGGSSDTSDKLHERFVIDKGTSAPVFVDVAKEAMFDLIPL